MLIFNVTESLSLIIGADMSLMEKIAFGLLGFVAFTYAGGAASVVAQKSKTKGFSYSYETEKIFMNECSQSANQRVCRCVFGKIKQQYSETDYWKLENDLRKNVDHPEYISYLTKAVEQCDAEYAEGSYGGSGDGLAGLLGCGGGGIATKAKGSIRTPSESDIEIGAGSSRSAADIMKVVRQRTPGLRHVYNKFLKKKPGFQGKVALKFTIDPSGVIISISIAASTTGYSEFDNEIKTAVSRWKFNTVKSGNTTITVPFTFSE